MAKNSPDLHTIVQNVFNIFDNFFSEVWHKGH